MKRKWGILNEKLWANKTAILREEIYWKSKVKDFYVSVLRQKL